MTKRVLLLLQVKLKHGTIRIEKIYADKIVYNKKDQKILAYGNSKFVHEKILITAREFNYNLNEKKIEAQYDVVLKDQNNNIYNLKKATFFELKK